MSDDHAPKKRATYEDLRRVIIPSTETLEVLALKTGRWTLRTTHAGAAIVRAEPFDAIDLDRSALWATG